MPRPCGRLRWQASSYEGRWWVLVSEGIEQIACQGRYKALQALPGKGFRQIDRPWPKPPLLICEQAGAGRLLLQQQVGSTIQIYS
ncbi:hypothetical protein BS643_03840 [Pseudomonas protegens]|nr:hypothetical protein BS644_28790 [Pseudomonas protegens]OKK50491.1 hypothetical protein BS643_03840 [Pseudomonas protegens]OKK56552.1 hypothetical protein BS645_21430 [Pseudomonas protegens]OKK64836.1 hypothetical protein BS646_13005 [Pseudomonas protegens]RLO23876.1 hypothetical protein EAG75_07810 [Pseudomonas protegens]